MVRTLKCHNTVTSCGPCPTSNLYHISLTGAILQCCHLEEHLLSFTGSSVWLQLGFNSQSYRDLFNPTNMRLVSSFNTLREQLAVPVIYEV